MFILRKISIKIYTKIYEISNRLTNMNILIYVNNITQYMNICFRIPIKINESGYSRLHCIHILIYMY